MRSLVLALSATVLIGCTTQTPTGSASSANTAVATPQPAASAAHQPVNLAQLSQCAEVKRSLSGEVVCVDTKRRTASTEVSRPTSTRPSQRRPQPGQAQYLVIGSFSDLSNAERWATYNAEFGTRVISPDPGAKKVYRVVVGPLENESPALLRQILSAVGIEGSWRLALCANAPVAGECPAMTADQRSVAKL